ncbi:TetR/AcrR family transcriptional regulator [Actinotignum urinale]|uniref:TetR/AcrR family transcriptional regulator n=1 Tax=Actinotignum urinale TaxID=190146 RepID=UPI0003B626BB|nr:TetR family transcriptional regulator [Actinotignum urinale]MDY5159627.1 TetR family transcriptional regulator [Actinotignum urinale]
MSMRKKTKGEQTKDRILQVAQQQFAKYPYEQVTTRSIAAEAGIDAAMIHRYFGSKEGLFAAIVENGIQTENLSKQMAQIPLEHLGEAIIRYGIELWSSPQAKPLMALLRRTLAENPHAIYRVLFPRFEEIISQKSGFSPEEIRLRVGLCFSQMLGFILARYFIEVESIAELNAEQAVQIIAPVLQNYLTGPLGWK